MDADARQTAALEERLRASRPVPDEDFVAALEERLLPRAAPRPASRAKRPLLVAAAASAALALAAVGFGLAGGGPLAPSGDEGVRAKDDCRYVSVRKLVRIPTVVTDRDGQPTIRYRSRVVTRKVKRCD